MKKTLWLLLIITSVHTWSKQSIDVISIEYPPLPVTTLMTMASILNY